MSEPERELWFIFSSAGEEWAGLRVATFVKTMWSEGFDIVIIHNEMADRHGPRIWADVARWEKWVKVKRIDAPTYEEVRAAVSEARS